MWNFGFLNQNDISNLSFTFIFYQHVAHIFSAFWQNMKVKLRLEMLFSFEKPKFEFPYSTVIDLFKKINC